LLSSGVRLQRIMKTKTTIIAALLLFLIIVPFVKSEDKIEKPPKLEDYPVVTNEIDKVAEIVNKNKDRIEGVSKKLHDAQENFRITIKNNIEPLNNQIENINKELLDLNDNNEVNLWTSFFVPLIASIIGAAIAGFCSLRATQNAHKNELKKQGQYQKKAIQNLLQSLNEEITILWKTYLWGVGNELEKLDDGQPLNIYYPLTQEYLTVYNNNSDLIGSIDNNELRSAIVEAYTMARSLIDSYRLNNDFVHQYEHWHWVSTETKNPLHVTRANAQLVALTNYAEKIKEIHRNLKDKVQVLIDLIEVERAKV